MTCSESRGVPDTTRPATPPAWSLTRFSRVEPRRRPKYFGFGRAWMLPSGTTKRIPSTAATKPPPHAWARSTSACPSIRARSRRRSSPSAGSSDRRDSWLVVLPPQVLTTAYDLVPLDQRVEVRQVPAVGEPSPHRPPEQQAQRLGGQLQALLHQHVHSAAATLATVFHAGLVGRRDQPVVHVGQPSRYAGQHRGGVQPPTRGAEIGQPLLLGRLIGGPGPAQLLHDGHLLPHLRTQLPPLPATGDELGDQRPEYGTRVLRRRAAGRCRRATPQRDPRRRPYR